MGARRKSGWAIHAEKMRIRPGDIIVYNDEHWKVYWDGEKREEAQRILDSRLKTIEENKVKYADKPDFLKRLNVDAVYTIQVTERQRHGQKFKWYRILTRFEGMTVTNPRRSYYGAKY